MTPDQAASTRPPARGGDSAKELAAARPGTTAGTDPSVEIPGIILDFLNRATIGVAGTRDLHLVPHVHRVSGWRVEPDREVLVCSITAAFTPHLMESVEDNGQFSLTIEEIGPHEAYQFKGRFVDAQPCVEADRHAAERVRERFVKVVSPMFGMSPESCRTFCMSPDLAVRFRVQEIYVQTPGPGAGRRLVPREDT